VSVHMHRRAPSIPVMTGTDPIAVVDAALAFVTRHDRLAGDDAVWVLDTVRELVGAAPATEVLDATLDEVLLGTSGRTNHRARVLDVLLDVRRMLPDAFEFTTTQQAC
jgi:hypothetical protein